MQAFLNGTPAVLNNYALRHVQYMDFESANIITTVMMIALVDKPNLLFLSGLSTDFPITAAKSKAIFG
jgi:hypothetical protein